MTLQTAKCYWPGNAAKARVIGQILNEVQRSKEDTLILDYGAGEGGDWPAILEAHRNIRLTCYEPSPKSYRRLCEKLKTSSANLLSGGDLEHLSLSANYIVSFSVFEHVYDRPAYLATAKRLLNRNGVFFLNYDDGHFRNLLDLNRSSTWSRELRAWLHNAFAGAIAPFFRSFPYLKRVKKLDADALVRKAGFRLESSRYENLSSLKGLQKTIPIDRQAEFLDFWIQVEDRLNEHFLAEVTAKLGDTANLWLEMGTRTLQLRHSQS